MKLNSGIVFTVLVCMVILMGCSKNPSVQSQNSESSKSTTSVAQSKESTSSAMNNSEENQISSDALPESWQGKWECVYSEANYFKKGETIYIKDFDNAVLYTNLAGSKPYTSNRWFCFNKEKGIIDIFNEKPPFTKKGIRDSFELKKESKDELVFTRQAVGQEVRFQKSNDTSTSSKELVASKTQEKEKSSVVSTKDEIITIKNNKDFSAIISTKNDNDPIIKEFAKKYTGCSIEFDGYIAAVNSYDKYMVSNDILILAGDYRKSHFNGPNFQFADVSVHDLGVSGSSLPTFMSPNNNVHVVAKVKQYDEISGLFKLDPVSIKSR